MIFWIYGLSLFGLATFLQSFFSNAKAAALTGTLVYFGTSFLDSVVKEPLVSLPQKTLASLLTTVAVSRGMNNLAQFESSGIGVSISNFNLIYENYSMALCCIMMTVSLVLFFFLGIYLDNVLPSTFGVNKKWYFCLTKNFWCGNSERNGAVKQIIQAKTKVHDSEMGKIKPDDEFFEAKYMKK